MTSREVALQNLSKAEIKKQRQRVARYHIVEDMLSAFDANKFKAWAGRNETEYYKMLVKLLPREHLVAVLLADVSTEDSAAVPTKRLKQFVKALNNARSGNAARSEVKALKADIVSAKSKALARKKRVAKVLKEMNDK